MIKDQLASGSLGLWQQLALVIFVAFFAGVTAWVFRRGRRDVYEACKFLPLADDGAEPARKGVDHGR